MNLYMGYSGDPEEGAVLIFANSAKEAKAIGWNSDILRTLSDDEYVYLRVRRLWKHEFLRKEAWSEEPHIVERPRCCNCCELWGRSEIGDDGLCDYCRSGDEPA